MSWWTPSSGITPPFSRWVRRTLTQELRQERAQQAEHPNPQKRAATRSKGHLTAIDTSALTGLRPFIGAQLAWDRLADLRTLAKLRGWDHGAPDGSRDLAVFIGASFLAQAVPNVPRFYDELRVLGREFAPHWTWREVNASASAVIDRMKRMAKGETIEYGGVQVDPRYKWRNDTLIQRFEITPDEERRLATIVSNGEAKRRHAEREVQRRAEKRDTAGKQTRAEYLSASEDKRASARLMRAQGMTQRAIAAELGVSVGSVNGWLKD